MNICYDYIFIYVMIKFPIYFREKCCVGKGRLYKTGDVIEESHEVTLIFNCT